jgi:hypothetical protein
MFDFLKGGAGGDDANKKSPGGEASQTFSSSPEPQEAFSRSASHSGDLTSWYEKKKTPPAGRNTLSTVNQSVLGVKTSAPIQVGVSTGGCGTQVRKREC